MSLAGSSSILLLFQQRGNGTVAAAATSASVAVGRCHHDLAVQSVEVEREQKELHEGQGDDEADDAIAEDAAKTVIGVAPIHDFTERHPQSVVVRRPMKRTRPILCRLFFSHFCFHLLLLD